MCDPNKLIDGSSPDIVRCFSQSCGNPLSVRKIWRLGITELLRNDWFFEIKQTWPEAQLQVESGCCSQQCFVFGPSLKAFSFALLTRLDKDLVTPCAQQGVTDRKPRDSKSAAASQFFRLLNWPLKRTFPTSHLLNGVRARDLQFDALVVLNAWVGRFVGFIDWEIVWWSRVKLLESDLENALTLYGIIAEATCALCTVGFDFRTFSFGKGLDFCKSVLLGNVSIKESFLFSTFPASTLDFCSTFLSFRLVLK